MPNKRICAVFASLIIITMITGCATNSYKKKLSLAGKKRNEAASVKAENYSAENFERGQYLLNASKKSYENRNYEISADLAEKSAKSFDLAIMDTVNKVYEKAKENTEKTYNVVLKNKMLERFPNKAEEIKKLNSLAAEYEKEKKIKEATIVYKRMNNVLSSLIKPYIEGINKWGDYAREGIKHLEETKLNKYASVEYENIKREFDSAESFVKEESYREAMLAFQRVSKMCMTLEDNYTPDSSKKACDEIEKLITAIDTNDTSINNRTIAINDFKDTYQKIKWLYLENKHVEVVIKCEELKKKILDFMKSYQK